MLKWIIRRRLTGFERAHDYDMSYAHDILRASLPAFRRFAGILGMAEYHQDVPLATRVSRPRSSAPWPRIAAPARNWSSTWRWKRAWRRTRSKPFFVAIRAR